jgi:hypothetical protein
MKKLVFTAVVIACLLTLSSVAKSVSEEIDGFRGMKWGMPISEIRKTQEFVMKQDDGKDQFVYYSIVNDELRFGKVNATSIKYFFWKDKFSGVVIVAKDEVDFDLLKSATDEKFGLGITGIGPSGEEIKVWDEEATVATLSYEMGTGRPQLVLFSKMINELKEGLEAVRAEKGSEKE